MAEVSVPVALPLVARIRARIAALGSDRRSGHFGPDRLQDFLDGALPARQMARIRAHVADCEPCATEARAWGQVYARLGGLARFAPEPGFPELVMARLGARSEAPAPVVAATWTRALAQAKRLVPQTRRAWAAISGVAVTPAVTVGLVLYAVFSHPTLTPGALASFVWWQLSDLALAAWSVASTAVSESASLCDV
jgi:anti-sigma factor RsiW